MKTIKLCLLLAIFPIISYGQTNNEFNKLPEIDFTKEEYLIIIFKDFSFNMQKAYVSINGKKFETITTKSAGQYDFNGAIKVMKDYNKKGWNLKTCNLSFREGTDVLFILMTKSKNNNIRTL